MIRYDVKTVRVESEHFPQGVLMNEAAFDPALHKKIGDEKPVQKMSSVKKAAVK